MVQGQHQQDTEVKHRFQRKSFENEKYIFSGKAKERKNTSFLLTKELKIKKGNAFYYKQLARADSKMKK